MAKELTSRQQEVLQYLKDFLAAKSYPPTVREIGRHFQMASPNGVFEHLVALEKKGMIRRQKGAFRALEVLSGQPAEVQERSPLVARAVPLAVKVVAGGKVLSPDCFSGEVAVDGKLWRTWPDFALKMKGNEMEGAGVFPGDVCLVHKQPVAKKGDLVVAVVDQEAIVRRFVPTTEAVTFRAENPAIPPLVVPLGSPYAIIGKVIGIMRVL